MKDNIDAAFDSTVSKFDFDSKENCHYYSYKSILDWYHISRPLYLINKLLIKKYLLFFNIFKMANIKNMSSRLIFKFEIT